MSDNPKLVHLEQEFEMHRGGELSAVDVAYETWGVLDSSGSNAILLFTGLSPSAHAAATQSDPRPGWWEDMLGPGRAIDTERYFVVCINSLGSCFGTTGPASINPATGRRYRLDFPVLSIEDIAGCGRVVAEALGISRFSCVLGPSMGGMTALAFGLLFPTMTERLVLVSSAARAAPFAIAVRSLQREAIRSDPAWNHGNYQDRGPEQGMHLARKLGMISYRSAEEWRTRFGRERADTAPDEPFGIEFEVESYLEHHAQKFTGSFDANCYLYLSRAMDLFDVADHGGCLEQGVACLEASKVLVVGVTTDILFPIWQQRELAALLKAPGRDVQLVELASVQGHDSFLVDMDRFRPVIGHFLA